MTSTKVRFYRNPVQSLCRPLRNSELSLLRLLEDHMLDEPACYRRLRYLQLTDMCPYCQSLTAYTLLRFEGLGRLYLQRLESKSTLTYVEIPWSFHATRFILRSLTREDIKYLDLDTRPAACGDNRASSDHATPPSRKTTIRETETFYHTTYRQFAWRRGCVRSRNEDRYYKDDDLDVSFRRLVLTRTRSI